MEKTDYIFGIRAVIEAIESGKSIDKVLIRKDLGGDLAGVGGVIYHRLENLLPSLYEEGANPFLLVLDGLTDTRNFGAIGRTADCSGVNGIVIPERNSVSVTPDAVKR